MQASTPGSTACGHRRSGPEIFIEFHLVVPGEVSVTQSHDLADHLEADLLVEYPRANVTIHIEPCTRGLYPLRVVLYGFDKKKILENK